MEGILVSGRALKRAAATHTWSSQRRLASTAVAARVGLAQVVSIHAVALHDVPPSSPALVVLSSSTLREGLERAAEEAARGAVVDVLVPADLAAQLLSPSSSSSAGPKASPLAAVASASASSPSSSVAALGPSLPAVPLREAAIAVALLSFNPWGSAPSSSSSPRPWSAAQLGQQDPPRLPGRGSTHLDAAAAVHATTDAAAAGGASSSAAAAARSGRQLAATQSSTVPAVLTPRQRLASACRAGDVAAIFNLLGSDTGLSPSSPLTVDDIMAHDPEHGATPLHLLVASPPSVVPVAPPRRTPLTPPDPRPYVDPVVRAIRALVRGAGADVDAPSGNGSTPLHWAAGAGAALAVAELLALGADPSARTWTWRRQVFGKGSGQTPLHWAGESNHTDIIDLLASTRPDCAVAVDERGRTPRELAEKEGAFEASAALGRAEARPFVVLRLRLESRAHGLLGAGAAMGEEGAKTLSTGAAAPQQLR
jgi:hypothetical protein